MASAARSVLNVRRVAVRLGALAIIVLALSASGAAADGITPSATSLNLAPGSSATIHSSLHLDALPTRADVLLALDTTGSMGAAIADAQIDANAIVGDIQSQVPNAKFAVADFKDYPTSPFGGSGDYPWRVDQNFTDNTTGSPCETLTPIRCALDSLTAGGGNDEPEAYNRAFFEAYDDSAHLSWDANTPRFMIVLGDSIPHDQNLNADFPSCPATTVTDPGSGFTVGDVTYPGVPTPPLHTIDVLNGLRTNHTNLSFVTYNPHSISGFPVANCHAALAQYTGGSEVVHGSGTDTLESQIVGLINAAAKKVDNVTFNVTSPTVDNANSWFTFTPSQLGPLVAPQDVPYDVTVTPPQSAPVGTYNFTIHAVADGAERTQQQVSVTVGQQTVSSLTMTSDESSIPAGIASVPFGAIPASRLPSLTADVQSAAAGSIAAGSIAAGSIAAGSISANRGIVNEAAQIVTRGESGNAPAATPPPAQ